MTKPESTAKTSPPQPTANPASWVRTLRETVESIVLALVLAFLFRTFEAEAFVIPTGSMAPTLQGRHKDVRCPKCGYEFRTGASEEVDESGKRQACNLDDVTCPMCRYTLDVDPTDPASPNNESDYPSYNGDRIIVNKFAYDISNPERWDVVVFKYPGDAKTDFIKRLVGLPNERIQIQYGDVYTAPLGSNNFLIARKPPHKVRATLQPVYDNDYVVPQLIEAGMPPRWQSWNDPGQSGTWQTSADYKTFEVDGKSPDAVWLRYQNILPNSEIWSAVDQGRRINPPAPSLIRDYYAYNAGTFSPGCPSIGGNGQHNVSDLAVDCQLDVQNDHGSVVLELVKGGVQFRCRINIASGEARLSISTLPDFAPTAQTALRGPGTYTISFSNVDEQLLLWVNGKVVGFNAPTEYPPLNDHQSVTAPAVRGSGDATDMSPVGIAADGGAAVKINHLKIWRDVYYTADLGTGEFIEAKDRSQILDLQDGQFFMLGDNSPRSKDSRYWRPDHYVDRNLLVGKALFVYWPHSFNYVEIGGKKITLPFWPNFARMRFVH